MPDKPADQRICKNCNSINVDKYCSNCGQKVHVERYTLKRFFSIILDAFNLEKGILYTFRMLLIKPGKTIHDYLNGRTKPYFNPLNYLLVAAGIYAVLVLWLNIFDTTIDATNELLNMDSVEESEEVIAMQSRFMESFKSYINLIPLMMIPFSSLISMLFFRSGKLFYGEHLIINSYLFAQGFYITLLVSPVVIIFPSIKALFGVILALIIISYLAYSFSKIFRRSVLRSIAGSFMVYIAGMLLFYLAFLLILIIFVIILKLFGYSLLDLF